MPATVKATEAAGVAVVDEALFKQRRSVALAIDFPLGDAAGKKAAAALTKKFKPAAMIFIEKVGPNVKGIYHSIMGTPRTPGQDRNAPTISPTTPRPTAFRPSVSAMAATRSAAA